MFLILCGRFHMTENISEPCLATGCRGFLCRVAANLFSCSDISSPAILLRVSGIKIFLFVPSFVILTSVQTPGMILDYSKNFDIIILFFFIELVVALLILS